MLVNYELSARIVYEAKPKLTLANSAAVGLF